MKIDRILAHKIQNIIALAYPREKSDLCPVCKRVYRMTEDEATFKTNEIIRLLNDYKQSRKLEKLITYPRQTNERKEQHPSVEDLDAFFFSPQDSTGKEKE